MSEAYASPPRASRLGGAPAGTEAAAAEAVPDVTLGLQDKVSRTCKKTHRRCVTNVTSGLRDESPYSHVILVFLRRASSIALQCSACCAVVHRLMGNIFTNTLRPTT
jgi:hypothetical protein